MTDNFYRAFEDRNRGSFEQIQERLRAYLPFVAPLKALHDDASVLDIGCGRGEWLALLRDEGFRVEGIDIDPAMLEPARERGLPVRVGDGIAHLAGLRAESVAVVSAFHVVEHLPFEQLQALVRESQRVLRPGGLLVLETPNAENLVVATSGFYMDPTHLHPVPAGLLTFLAQHYGFARAKLLRLQEPEWLEQATPAVISILRDVSPDAGVVAQKPAAPDVMSRFDAAFAREYGVAVEAIAGRYDAYNDSRFTAAHARIGELEGRIAQAVIAVQAAESAAQQARARADQAEQECRQVGSQIEQMLASASWRVTTPLRALADTISRILGRKP
jgi:O-antigen chain-terminating methyltransferase